MNGVVHALDKSDKGLKTKSFAAREDAFIRCNMGAVLMLQEANCAASAASKS